jgi:diguanylate cyclase (GGDEF)-like protein
LAIRVIALCRLENPDINVLAQTLSNDPGLATKLLRVVNAPSFGNPKRVTTLRQATGLLGLNSVRTLALSFTIAQGMKRTQKLGFRWFWKRSVIASVAARAIAVSHKVCDPEVAFLAALLQDIGILALGQVGDKQFENLRGKQDEHAEICAEELAQLGCDHAEVGAWLAQHWELPASLVAGIRYSHEPDRVPTDLDAEAAAIAKTVALSGVIADIWVHANTNVATRTALEAALRVLGVSRGAFRAILSDIGDKMQEVADFLDVQIGTRRETDAILEQAREALSEMSLRSGATIENARRTISELERRERELLLAAQRDSLTGLGNRGFLEVFLQRCFAEAVESQQPLSIVMVDLDRFKTINDTFGHQTGDAVIKATAKVLAAGIRPLDLAGRYGGEEFMLVLPSTDAVGAAICAERMRSCLAGLEIITPTGMRGVTASFGCATLDRDAMLARVGVAELIGAADAAFYVAKHKGRNRVEQRAVETACAVDRRALAAPV